jgi:hypothetical protein
MLEGFLRGLYVRIVHVDECGVRWWGGEAQRRCLIGTYVLITETRAIAERRTKMSVKAQGSSEVERLQSAVLEYLECYGVYTAETADSRLLKLFVKIRSSRCSFEELGPP